MTDLMYTIGAKFDGADKVNQALQNIDRSADSTVKAIKRFDQEMKRANAAQAKGTLTEQGYTRAKEEAIQRLMSYGVASDRATQSVERNTAAMQRGQRVTLQTGSAQQALRQRFLETANSIAVLDGPLGGVASRFSSFGVLVGRTGIALATFGVAFTSLTVLATRGVREFAEFEVQLATIENRLNSTSTQVNLTSREVANLADKIALSTLASEKALLSAAAQVLTFGNITTDTFESVLRSATDLAASGFGTVESSAIMLSKALEDPRQSLTSLSRAGVTFTRQQRAMIISMVEAGRQAEAMALILAQVNRQVGGAAEAQARDTLAGQFDTIAQAVRRSIREFGEFITTELGVRKVIETLAGVSERYLESLSKTPRQELEELEQQLKDHNALLKEGKVLVDAMSTAFTAKGETTLYHYEKEEERLKNLIALKRREIHQEETLKALQEARGAIDRRSSAIDAIQGEVEVRQQNLFLTEEQVRVNRELAAQGFGAGGVEGMAREIETLISTMREAGANGIAIDREIERLNALLEEAKRLSKDVAQSFEDTKISSALISNLQTLEQQNETQRLINEAMLGGADAAEARRVAEDAMLDTLVASARAVAERTGKGLEAVEALERELNTARELRDQHEAITKARQAQESIEGLLQNLQDELKTLELQEQMLKDGASQREIQVALTRLQNDLEIARNRLLVDVLFTEGQITAQKYAQLQLALSAADVANKQIALTRISIAELSGGGTRGGGSAAREEVDKTQQAIDKLREQLQIEQALVGVNEDRARLIRAMGMEFFSLNETQIQQLESEINKVRELSEAYEKQRQAADRAAQRMTDLFMSAMQGGDAFKRTLANIIQELARMAAMRAFQTLIKGSGGGILTSLFGFADGAAFKGGSVVPFANGGVVGSPTLFPMSGGKTGLMGEAGPEAIIPLKRNSKGQLGVEGGVTQAVSVTYAPQISVKGSGEEVAALRQEIARMNAEAPARIISTIQKAQKKRVL
jgi:hypothetical protein